MVDQEVPPLLSFYRGHSIIILVDELLSAEVSEHSSGFPFPMKVSATREEGLAMLMDRARDIIDVSIGAQQLGTIT